jgi:phosphatidylglycerophosphate synthase
MNALIDLITNAVRSIMYRIAKGLNIVSRGKLSPNAVTWTGLIMHLPIAVLIGVGKNELAAVLLVVFGLFDALDGALARIQKKTSNAGMLLDASTDRMKEVLLYSGAAYALASLDRPHMAAWAVAACGASICVSYIKAKGETAVKDSNLSPNEINRLFSDGLFRFQVRMLILAIGLLSNQILIAVIVIAVCSTLTAFERLYKISRKLS